MNAFTKLLSQHVGTAFARQIQFGQLLGDRNFNVNIKQGVVTFGRDLQYQIQLLGTEAEGDNSWLWAWANEGSNFPTNILQSCNALRDFGTQHTIEELTNRSFSLDVTDGHSISLTASGLNDNCCYYRAPYSGGALFFLVFNVPNEVFPYVDAAQAIEIITDVISNVNVEHWIMCESFLNSQGFTLELSEDKINAIRGNDAIKIIFDSQQRIAEIGASLQSKLLAT
ncbi:DUF6882 domain-containing protein [Chamaesiphon polymorphus]|uniref:Uncharacterized protein n=1 Tax=Chamaesiphon polymorphus CCALA 037 TaxID=2107692 RepID=A0A2T1G100_9CYAN|nr:DUF6882 domain-containing protein [Chamaesiphon polymorphus]PSB50925.1 hypothetical protein C7B77_22155 [Chamaesiphon polymorphus CCALA 037]